MSQPHTLPQLQPVAVCPFTLLFNHTRVCCKVCVCVYEPNRGSKTEVWTEDLDFRYRLKTSNRTTWTISNSDRHMISFSQHELICRTWRSELGTVLSCSLTEPRSVSLFQGSSGHVFWRWRVSCLAQFSLWLSSQSSKDEVHLRHVSPQQ